MKTYLGRLPFGDRSVIVLDHATDQRYALPFTGQHSPDGFAWGYGGSGPAELALALLNDALLDGDWPIGRTELAEDLHQAYKRDVIAGLAMDRGWTLTQSSILTYVRNAIERLVGRPEEGLVDPDCPARDSHAFGVRCPACGGVA